MNKALKALALAFLLSCAAGAAQAQQAPVSLQVIPNGTTLNSGNTLRVTLTAFYRGPAFTADFYFGVIHPDGVNATFVVNLNPLTAVVRRLDQPITFPPLFAGITIPANFTTSLPSFFEYKLTPAEALGTYNFFAALTAPRAFDNGIVDGTDLIGFAQRAITIVAPPTSGGCPPGVRC